MTSSNDFNLFNVSLWTDDMLQRFCQDSISFPLSETVVADMICCAKSFVRFLFLSRVFEHTDCTGENKSQEVALEVCESSDTENENERLDEILKSDLSQEALLMLNEFLTKQVSPAEHCNFKSSEENMKTPQPQEQPQEITERITKLKEMREFLLLFTTFFRHTSLSILKIKDGPNVLIDVSLVDEFVSSLALSDSRLIRRIILCHYWLVWIRAELCFPSLENYTEKSSIQEYSIPRLSDMCKSLIVQHSYAFCRLPAFPKIPNELKRHLCYLKIALCSSISDIAEELILSLSLETWKELHTKLHCSSDFDQVAVLFQESSRFASQLGDDSWLQILANDFLDVSYGSSHKRGQKLFYFDQRFFSIFETQPSSSFLTIAGRVWDCAPILCDYLDSCKSLVSGKKVLELGCGPGLVGIVASSLGAARVLMTDLNLNQVGDPQISDKGVLELAYENALLNLGQSHVDTHITVLDLAWGQINTSLLPQNMQSPCQTPQNPTISSLVPFDVVLGSDLVYDAANHRSLVHTLLATTNQRSRILLSCRHRPCWDPEVSRTVESVAKFSSMAIQYFTISSVFRVGQVEILQLCRK